MTDETLTLIISRLVRVVRPTDVAYSNGLTGDRRAGYVETDRPVRVPPEWDELHLVLLVLHDRLAADMPHLLDDPHVRRQWTAAAEVAGYARARFGHHYDAFEFLWRREAGGFLWEPAGEHLAPF